MTAMPQTVLPTVFEPESIERVELHVKVKDGPSYTIELLNAGGRFAIGVGERERSARPGEDPHWAYREADGTGALTAEFSGTLGQCRREA